VLFRSTGRHPDFRTINRFRVRHREDFAEVFRQTVRLARASGLGALGVVAIDGTKIRALEAQGDEGKKLPKWPRGLCTQRMHRLLRLPWAKRSYARRKTQGERPFAEIKAVMGFRRFMLRGVHKIRGEWDLVCAAFNLRRLAMRAAATI